MFKRKKKKTGVQTPELRRPTPPPPPPTSGSNAVKPSELLKMLKDSPVTVLPTDISTVAIMCHYETPCGWCCKWDKKCDKKIGCDDNKPKRGLRANTSILDDYGGSELDDIRSGKGLSRLDATLILTNPYPQE